MSGKLSIRFLFTLQLYDTHAEMLHASVVYTDFITVHTSFIRVRPEGQKPIDGNVPPCAHL